MKKIIKKHWLLCSIIIFLSLIQDTSIVLSSVFLSEFINFAIDGKMRAFQISFGIYVGIILLLGISWWVKNNVTFKLKWKINCDLRHVQISNILNLEQARFHDKAVGNYLSSFTNDIYLLEDRIISPFFAAISNIFTIIITSITVIMITWVVFVPMVILFLFSFLIPKLYAKKTHKYNVNIIKAFEKYTSKIKNLISGFGVIYEYHLFKSTQSESATISKELEDVKYDAHKYSNFAEFNINLINIISQIITVLISLLLFINGNIEFGWILGLGTMIGTFFNSSSVAINSALKLKGAKPLFDKFKIDPVPIWNQQETLLPLNTKIDLSNISLKLNDKPILENVNMEFMKNNKYAIVGMSGAGKTSLFKVLTLFYSDYTGAIKWNDKTLNRNHIRALHNQICYISQDSLLFNGTLKENIILEQAFDLIKMQRVIKLSGLENLTNDDNYEMLINDSATNVSGGQKQRIVIARGLYHDKKIFLFDEATSALDRETSEKIECSLLCNKDFTVIIISHHLSPLIEPLFDKIYQIPKIANKSSTPRDMEDQ